MRYRVTLINPTLGSIVLQKEPVGLKEIAPILRRGENHGFTVEVEVDLQFYCGAGKEIIDQVRNEQGVDGVLEIVIDSLCGGVPSVDAPDYSIDYSDDYGSFINGTAEFEEFYRGLFDLKTWREEDSPDGKFTFCDINPAGIVNTVKNRLDTKVDLFATETLDGTAIASFTYGGYDLTLHGKVIQLASLIDISDEPDGYSETATGSGIIGGTGTVTADLPFNNVSYDDLGALTLPSAPFVQSTVPIVFPNAAPTEIFTNNTGESIDVDIAYDIQGVFTELGSLDREYDLVLYYKLASSFGLAAPIALQSYGHKVLLADQTMTENISETGVLSLTIPDGYNFYLYVQLTDYTTGGGTRTSTVTTSFTALSLRFTQDTIFEDTTTKAFAVFETGAQIARVITDQQDAFRSNIFGRVNSEPFAYDSNGCLSFMANTNGFMARGFPTTGEGARTIRLSMNDYFKGLNPIGNLGMGVEKIGDNYFLVVDEKSYFYDASTTILTLNNVPNIKRYEVADKYYARVNIGYETWETEFTNGLDEVNSKRQYDTGIKAVSNELNLISELVASGYRIELARRIRYIDQNSEDTQYDEDNFIICLGRAEDYITGEPTELDIAEKDENFSQVENLISPETSYNLRISPARNLLRWNSVVNSGLQKYPGREIKFTSGEGNYKMESAIDGDCPGSWNNTLLSEGQNIQWDDSDNTDKDPIWLPEGADINFPITKAQHDLIMANPKGVIEFSNTDQDHEKWFILDYKFKEGDLSEFKLLKAFV